MRKVGCGGNSITLDLKNNTVLVRQQRRVGALVMLNKIRKWNFVANYQSVAEIEMLSSKRATNGKMRKRTDAGW
jgi:hypothetical protein